MAHVLKSKFSSKTPPIKNLIMKKFEYIEREFHIKLEGSTYVSVPLIETLNDYGQYGYCVVSAVPVMFLNDPNLINKWIVIFVKEIE